MAHLHQQQHYVATYFSIDVECVATGVEHNAREVAQIALVDQFERCLLNVYVTPPEGATVASYLTPLTGEANDAALLLWRAKKRRGFQSLTREIFATRTNTLAPDIIRWNPLRVCDHPSP